MNNYIASSEINKLPRQAFLIPTGKELDPLLRGFNFVNNIEKSFLICSKESESVADELIERLKNVVNDFEKILVNPTSFDDIIIKVFSKVKDYDFIFVNLTGGTKVMVLSLYFVAQLMRSCCFYIYKNLDDNSMERFSIPIIPLSNEKNKIKDRIGKRKREILALLYNEKRKMSELISELGIKRSTLTGHTQILEQMNLIEKRKVKGEAEFVITSAGRIVSFLLKERGDEYG